MLLLNFCHSDTSVGVAMQNSEGLVPCGLLEAASGVMVQETAGGNRAPTSLFLSSVLQ